MSAGGAADNCGDHQPPRTTSIRKIPLVVRGGSSLERTTLRDIAFDTETTGLRWQDGDVPFMLQASNAEIPDGTFILMQPALDFIASGKADPDHVYAEGAITYEAMRRMMADGDTTEGHNAPFDVHHLRAGGWELELPWVDTQTLAQIVAPERRFAEKAGINPLTGDYSEAMQGYHLKELSQIYVDPHAQDSEAILQDLAKSHGFSLKAKPGSKDYMPAAYFVLWQLEPEAMEFYAREDVRLTRGLRHKLEAKLTDERAPGQPGTRRIWELEQAVAPIIVAAESIGIRVDGGEKAVALKREYQLAAEQARETLEATLGDGWGENNETLAAALLAHGVPLTETTDNGGLAVNKHALGRFEGQFPIIQTLFDYRTNEKFVSTYLDHFIGKDVIHPTFAPIGAWTGRMAGREPNMQNIPVHAGTAVRELFLPRDGMAFIGIDFEQIELRDLGYYLNNAAVIKMIEETDYFAHQAARTVMPGMEFYAHKGDDEFFRKGHPGAEWRQTNKNATYAIVYGVGAGKLGKMLGWPPDSVYTERDWVVQRGFFKAGDPRNLKAEAFKKLVISELRGYGKLGYKGPGSGSGLMGRIGDKVAATGYVDTILGRHQWLGKDGAWKGASAVIQGSAADQFKLAVVEATPAVAYLGAYPVLFIHDEILFEGPIDAAEEIARVGSEAMSGIMPDFRPRLSVEASIGYNSWADAK